MQEYRMKQIFVTLLTIIITWGITRLPAETLDERIDSLINTMSLDEKIDQLSNNGFMTTPDNERLNIPGFIMDDGPHGVRFETATCFPLPMAMAAAWDRDLWHSLGEAMGREFHAFGKHVQLGPCIDMCRDPRNGRSGESGGEDPYLCGQLGMYTTKGIQNAPVIATAKHYNCVNTQDNRNTADVTISERQLMGHYGYNFQKTVQEGGALSVMSAYNLINGDHASESNLILNEILKNRWGFPFMVMSDWGSVHNTEKAVKAGNDLCMGNDLYSNELSGLMNNRDISEETLNASVRRVILTKMLSGITDSNYPEPVTGNANTKEHQQLCLEADRKALVLLKNQDDILPLPSDADIALIGPSADKAQMNIFGSSNVTPPYSVSPKQGFEDKAGPESIEYAKGCDISGNDESGFQKAKDLASASDYVVFVGGLDKTMEGENYCNEDLCGGDRKNGTIQLPEIQQSLINQLASVNQNLVVILESGGICAVNTCFESIKGLLYAFYTSQEGGNAIADVVFGDYNPAGRLPVTMPLSDDLMPESNSDFTDDYNTGYRYYDATGNEYQYAFGYGLSYTDFSYNSIDITPAAPSIGERINVSIQVENTGNVKGEEVVQVYISTPENGVWQPQKELKDFKRVEISKNETKRVDFTLDAEDFYDYSESDGKYTVHQGEYTVKAGGSSDNLPLSGNFSLSSTETMSDLRPVNIYTFPRFPETGDSVFFLATVKNYGVKGVEPGNISVNWRIDNSIVASSGKISEGIQPGGMILVSSDTEAGDYNAWTPESGGEYLVEAKVDPENAEEEYYENNNTISEMVYFPGPSENIALDASVEASSVEQDAENPESVAPANVTDGDTETRWASEFADSQYITIDLSEIREFTDIKIHWEAAYASDYSIQVSDSGISWKTIKEVSNSDGGLEGLNTPSSGRYIRIYCIQRSTSYGFSIYEVEVYNNTYYLSGNTESIDAGQKTDLELAPFSTVCSSVRIRYSIDRVSRLSLQIFDLKGSLIKTLTNRSHEPGRYEALWRGETTTGNRVSSGIYIIRMRAESRTLSKKCSYLE